MRPEPIAKRQTWAAPTNTRRSAVHAESKHSLCGHSSRAKRITLLDRPLVEAEWDMVRRFVRRMEREDLRLRFGHPLDLCDEITLRRAFDIKAGVGEISWLLDETAAIAGLAHRIMVSRAQAEVGLIVRSDLKRTGIGELLLREMLARSAQQGLETLSGLVLSENRAMLRLAAKIGFAPRQVCAFTAELTLELG
jgi:RimJ/RimL family protein N-acetyltransferase